MKVFFMETPATVLAAVVIEPTTSLDDAVQMAMQRMPAKLTASHPPGWYLAPGEIIQVPGVGDAFYLWNESEWNNKLQEGHDFAVTARIRTPEAFGTCQLRLY
eukprot:INCI16207.2.p1 GENE.INCI16207.2~~INCI16207.2.p1  ORF type:complete len:103 (+),score=12.32 INCI16207.2:72-380(+)